MSTTKRGISLLLCLSLLVSMFSMLGAIMPKAFAADGESTVKSYADCLADYGPGFVYMGVDFYEFDEDDQPVLSDYYVDAGQELEARFYLKTDRYVGDFTVGMMWDHSFFEATTGEAYDAVMNPNYSAVAPANAATNGRAMTVAYSWREGSQVSGGVVRATNKFLTPAADPTLKEEITKAWMAGLYATQFAVDYENQTVDKVWAMTEDNYVYSIPVKVKDGLAEGTTGFTMNAIAFWKAAVAQAPWDMKFTNNADAEGGDAVTLGYTNANNSTSYYHFDGCQHTFTIGTNPADEGGDEPGGSTEGTSAVKSYADCLADFGPGFVYMGVDFYEFDEDNKPYLTDHFVDAGQELEARFYLKTDRYVGDFTVGMMWDHSFFEATTGEAYDAVMNPNYSAVAPANAATNGRAMTVAYSWREGSQVSGGVVRATNKFLTPAADPTLKEEITKAWMAGLYATQFAVDYENQTVDKVWAMTEDNYVYSIPVKVKEGLAEGTTGFTMNAIAFWKAAVAQAPWDMKFTNNADAEGGDAVTLGYTNANNSTSYYHFDGCQHTFTIGAAGPVAKTYTATFYTDADKTEVIEAQKLEEGAAITPPAAIDGQLGWADLATGSMVETFPQMGKKNLNYARVMEDDTFDVIVNLDGGAVDPATLPDNAKDNGDGTVTISAPMNSEVDLSAIQPTKEGYEAAFDPATVTVDNINGKDVKVTWNPKNYNVSLYLDKGDAEPWTVLQVAFNSTLRGRVNGAKPTKEGYAFVKWLNVEDDSETIPNTLTEAKDLAYYATWNELDSSFAYMIYDYAAEDWKEAGKVYGNSGNTLTIGTVNTFRNKLTAADFGLETMPTFVPGSNAYTVDGTGYSSTSTATTLTFDGAKEIRINTRLTANVTFNVPVYDEATESYTDETTPIQVGILPDNNAAEKTVVVYKTDVTPADYYTVYGWIDAATGEPADNVTEKGTSYEFTLDLREPHTYVADIRLTEYAILAYIGDSSNTALLSDQTFTLGEEVDLYALTFAGGEIPAVGHINTMDPEDGTLQVRGRDGYEMTKWIESGSKKDIAPTFTLDKDVLYKGNLIDEVKLQVSAVWTAHLYNAEFYYIDASGNETLYKTVSAPTGAALSTFRPDQGEDNATVTAEINAAAAAGKIFAGTWTAYKLATGEEVGAKENHMWPGGMKYVANYDEQGVSVYQHFNNENSFDEDGKPILKRYATPTYGSHLLAGYLDPDATFDQIGKGTEILNTRFPDTNAEKPAETQSIGWKTYHVLDAADLNNPDKWIEGINEITDPNDPDYDVIKYPTIFQAQWKANKDFFFRVYGEVKVVLTLPINGAKFGISIEGGDLYCALGKDFKMYYWENQHITTKNLAVLESDDTIVPIFFMLRLENFDIKGFFKPDMWKHVYLRIDQLRLPFIGTKAFWTFKGQKDFWDTIITLIKSLTAKDEGEGGGDGIPALRF